MRTFFLGAMLLALLLQGCGADHPFRRGPEVDDGGGSSGPVGPVSFSADVQPLLGRCTGCHAGGTGGWTYSGGPNAHAQALTVVDTANPAGSLLLVKASGGAGHGGGTLFSSTSSSYQTILAWIQNGAPNN